MYTYHAINSGKIHPRFSCISQSMVQNINLSNESKKLMSHRLKKQAQASSDKIIRLSL